MGKRMGGVWPLLGTYALWGVSPIFYHALADVPAAEVLAHRTIWSLVLFGAVLAAQGRLATLPRALASRHLGRIVLAALMISLNWGVFIWSVQNDHVMESSLGYYIFPLTAVVLGIVVFKERLHPEQRLAVILAALAVGLLTWGLGAAPWISLILAASMGVYGVVKKALPLDPVLSVTAEVAVLSPLALGWLVALHAGWLPPAAGLGRVGEGMGVTTLLVLSGPMTAVPLMLFALGAQRANLATVGLIGYVNPTLQLVCAVALFGEPFTIWHGMAFAMIWTALALYSAATWRQQAARADA
ncbi:EamA family transporter RarD [Paracoccus endophyticus]|uniref:EamA family transporter RarD n=1 Tax=Paracoccus endophyticus TaxID=2233774 RepID=UPI000DDC06C7|nr:EamA family transporter RarD [Paracoccus endophyticus]